MIGLGVTAIMVTLEFLEVGLNTVNKAAMSKGMSNFVLVVYSNILAIFILLPVSFLVHRKQTRPTITWSIVCKIFGLSILSCCGQMFTYIGLRYSSPTLASAMADLTPAFTFILAIFLRVEKLNLRVRSNQAKSVGTVVSITGALIVTLYKGMPITLTPSMDTILNQLFLLPQSNWILGGLFLAAHSLTLALFYVVLTWIIRDYPAEVMVTFICCIFVTMLSSMVSLLIEDDPNAWKLGSNIEFISIVYSALFAVALRSATHAWALRKKGPVYVSMFKPLGMVIALVMGVTFLGDTLYLGSVIGAAIIALGFYSVIWGKAQEEKMVEDSGACSFESCKAPLLV